MFCAKGLQHGLAGKECPANALCVNLSLVKQEYVLAGVFFLKISLTYHPCQSGIGCRHPASFSLAAVDGKNHGIVLDPAGTAWRDGGMTIGR